MPQGVKKYFRFFLGLTFILACTFFSSCKDENCVSTFNNDLLVSLLQTDTLENGNVVFKALDTLFFEVKAVANESVLYDFEDKVSKLVLPVNPAEDMTTFEFYMIDSVRTDTISMDPINIQKTYYKNETPHVLSVSYRRGTRLLSEDCGVEIVYVRLKVDATTFSGINVVNDRLSRFNLVNIEVLF
jgi:hypothetical protein